MRHAKSVEPAWLGLTRTEWLLAVTVLLLVGIFVHPYRAQQASRYTLTAAIVEQRTVVLDDYSHVLGRDRAIREDHIYSDKAPGQPFMAVPFFAVGKAIGVEDATVLRVNANLGLWWITFWSAALPGAALAVMMYRRTSSLRCRGSLLATWSTFAGTLLLPFSALLFGHVLAAALLYGAFMFLSGRPGFWSLVGSGALAGLAVGVEYTAALGVAVLAVYSVWRHRMLAMAWLAGGLPAALALAAYNKVAFGDPLTLSYQYSAFHEVASTSRSVFFMFSSATLENLTRLLMDGRGLLVATPIVIVAVVAAISTSLKRGKQDDVVMAIAMFAIYLMVPILWGNPWGGASPGPRYMSLALPFLVVPVAQAWVRWPRFTAFTAGVSVLTMSSATVTEPLLRRDTADGLNTWLQRLLNGEAAPTLLTLTAGELGWLVHIVIIVSALMLLVRSHKRRLLTAECL